MTQRIFVQIGCEPGTEYRVSDGIAALEFCSEIHSTIGDFDLSLRNYGHEGEDIGGFVDQNLQDAARNVRTLTFKAF